MFTKIYTLFLIRIPQIGVSLSYFLWTQKPSCSFFSIFIFIQKTFSELIYSDTSAKKSMFFSDKGALKTKLYQVLFKKPRGACWYALHNMSLIINNIFFPVAPTHRCANFFLKEFCLSLFCCRVWFYSYICTFCSWFCLVCFDLLHWNSE